MHPRMSLRDSPGSGCAVPGPYGCPGETGNSRRFGVASLPISQGPCPSVPPGVTMPQPGWEHPCKHPVSAVACTAWGRQHIRGIHLCLLHGERKMQKREVLKSQAPKMSLERKLEQCKIKHVHENNYGSWFIFFLLTRVEILENNQNMIEHPSLVLVRLSMFGPCLLQELLLNTACSRLLHPTFTALSFGKPLLAGRSCATCKRFLGEIGERRQAIGLCSDCTTRQESIRPADPWRRSTRTYPCMFSFVYSAIVSTGIFWNSFHFYTKLNISNLNLRARDVSRTSS